mmetsp:Transcript_22593/g.53339  ORF Transcript_22593/g.53339 Transcript_22593/m.53339 type:complete len:163 (-) Transcript_22593:1283-1771(-)
MSRNALAVVGLAIVGAVSFQPPNTVVAGRRRGQAATVRLKQENALEDLDELARPRVSLTRSSVLFDDSAQTQANNEMLDIWRESKALLPAIVTGAWDKQAGDARPFEHLYNLVFVRLPTILAGLVYTKNLFDGHPLIISFGDSSNRVVPPLIVFCIIGTILR